MIPTTSSSVNVEDLHPTLKLRVEAMLADPRMKGYRVVSGVRSYALQKSLYSGWRKRLAGIPGFGHYNRAANPDAAGAPTFDGLRFRGSYHMEQDDGYGHAVDLRAPVTHSTSKRWSLVGTVGADYGLRQTVPGEWWHLQARDRAHWFDAPRIATPTPRQGKAKTVLYFYKTDVFGLPISWWEGWGVTSAIGPETAIKWAEQGVAQLEFTTLGQAKGMRERSTNLVETTADRHWLNLADAIGL